MRQAFLFLGILLSSLAVSAQKFPTTPPSLRLSAPMPTNLFVELARVVNPSVVNISTTAAIGQRTQDPLLEMLEQFYGVPRTPRNHPNRPRQLALGTGFIVREDGLIVTNAHVVRGADNIHVQLSEDSDKIFEAELIGSDDRSDIALIKIKPEGKLTVAVMGSSKDLKVGEWVAAFGNPFGHGHTMTKGIISSIGRSIGEINRFPLIQTDASINPGNSGGPLVDSEGFVIGVNSAIDARAQGIGFAIPIDEVKKILPELEATGHIRKAYLGVGLGDMDARAAEQYDLTGAVVVTVEPNTPAAKAKIRPYDIITEFNKKKIHNSTELMDAVAGAPIGQKIDFKIMRQSGNKFREHKLSVVLKERPSTPTLSRRENKPKIKGVKVPYNLGFRVADATDELRELLGLQSNVKKPVVVDVERRTPASLVGISPGDVIIDVNKTEVTTASDVVKNLKKGENTLRLARGNRIIFIVITSK